MSDSTRTRETEIESSVFDFSSVSVSLFVSVCCRPRCHRAGTGLLRNVMNTYISTYTYTYRKRETERERQRGEERQREMSICINIHIYK